MRPRLPCRERILLQSVIVKSGCREWTGSRDKNGYGYVKRNGKTTKAHRASYSEFVGEIPIGLCVCHHCDNPSCIEPSHLFLGTLQDNNLDKKLKGRGHGWKRTNQGGEGNSNCKLTRENIRDIRSRYKWGMGPSLAKEFKVSVFHIRKIMRQKMWCDT